MRAYYSDHPVGVARDVLGLSPDAARDQMRAFEAAGFVERRDIETAAGDDWWITTIKGNALAQASFGKPISRATAMRHLTQVIERARSYNADPARLLTIAEIAVFGSYLDASRPSGSHMRKASPRRPDDRDPATQGGSRRARLEAFPDLTDTHWTPATPKTDNQGLPRDLGSRRRPWSECGGSGI